MFTVESPPHDALERLAWLTEKRREFDGWLEGEYQLAYFEARLTGRLEDALALALHGRKRVLAWTRRENSLRGRMVRWSDGADKTSTGYLG